MTKSELIEKLATDFPHIQVKDVESAVKEILEQMAGSLAVNERIEIRGFGSFSLHYRAPRVGRNPKTGEMIPIAARRVVTFHASQKLKDVVESHARENSI